MKMIRFTAKTYGKNFYFLLSASGLLTGIAVVSQIALVWILGVIIDAVGEGLTAVLKYFTEMCIMLAVSIFFSAAAEFVSGQVRSRFRHRLQTRFGESLCHANYTSVEKETDGELLTMATGDIDTMLPLVSELLSLIQIPIKVFLPLVLMFVINVKLALAMLPLMAVSLLPTLLLVKKLNPLYTAEKKIYARTTGFFNEVLDFFTVVKAYCLETVFRKKHDELFADCKRAKLSRQLREQVIWTFGRCLGVIVNPLVFIVAAYLILNGQMQFGQIFTIILLAKILAEGLNLVYEFPPKYAAAQASMKRLIRIMDAPVEDTGTASSIQVGCIKHEAVYEANDLTFGYGDCAVIHNLSFAVKRGEKIAVVGPSGGGKTTLFKLLQGLYMTDTGLLTFMGTDIKMLTAGDLRRNISAVTQESFIFPGTIKENLLLAKPDADDEMIQSACRAAHIHDFIMSLDKQYDTALTGSRTILSKGQAQRLGIARAFLKDAPVWLFDEPVSGLDPATAEGVVDYILKQNAEKTVIVILHDMKRADQFDRVIRLEGGRIV